jgi:NAD(P)-dependent dehydrogenase (short-subunit alcohol dehydrogenase family)
MTSDPGALDLFDMTGRVAVVTGASAGLGHRFAQCLAKAGATVVVAARREPSLAALVAETDGVELAVASDVKIDDQCHALIDRTIAEFGRVDVLVNNAGVTNVAPALSEGNDTFRDVVAVNLVAPYVLAKAVAEPMLQHGGGSIINVASIFGIVGVGAMPQAAYVASKGGLINLTRELSAQWSAKGVRVNAIAPGFFQTEMTTGLWDDERSLGWLKRNTPMRRGGTADELDGALLFLASGASSYVTGQVIVVDGGWTSV